VPQGKELGLENILIKNSSYRHTTNLKNKIIQRRVKNNVLVNYVVKVRMDG
jgi:hypothetical protein